MSSRSVRTACPEGSMAAGEAGACCRCCARGLFREAYSGTTLRDHLGLPEPANRYAHDS